MQKCMFLFFFFFFFACFKVAKQPRGFGCNLVFSKKKCVLETKQKQQKNKASGLSGGKGERVGMIATGRRGYVRYGHVPLFP